MSFSAVRPSNAHRWMHCAGSPRAEEGVRDETSEFAAQGTVFHEIAAMCAQFGLEPEDFFGQFWVEGGFRIEIDEEMVKAMRPGLELIRQLSEGNDLFIELTLPMDDVLGPQKKGTLDIGIIDWVERIITIFDWKYGKGVQISAEQNEQLQIYAWTFFEKMVKPRLQPDETPKWKVRIIIEQPRIRAGGGQWLTDLSTLDAFADRVRHRVREVENPNAPRSAAYKTCFFCKAKRNCGEFQQFNLDTIDLAFDDIDQAMAIGVPPPLPPVERLTPERRSYIILHAKMFESFLQEVHASALRDALVGLPTPELVVVAGRNPPRKYRFDKEEEAQRLLVEELGDEAFVRKPLSPTQAEIKLKPEAYTRLSAFIDYGTAKPSLVHESSKKERLKSAVDLFEEES